MKSEQFFILLAVAFGIAIPAALSAWLSKPDGSPRPPPPRKRWEVSLDGKKIELPAVDSFGKAISLGQPRLLIVLSCAGCTLKQFGSDRFVGPPKYGETIIAFDGRKEEIPAGFRNNPKLRILCYPVTKSLPGPAVRVLPQAFLLSANNVVEDRPRDEESLDEFLNSNGVSRRGGEQ